MPPWSWNADRGTYPSADRASRNATARGAGVAIYGRFRECCPGLICPVVAGRRAAADSSSRGRCPEFPRGLPKRPLAELESPGFTGRVVVPCCPPGPTAPLPIARRSSRLMLLVGSRAMSASNATGAMDAIARNLFEQLQGMPVPSPTCCRPRRQGGSRAPRGRAGSPAAAVASAEPPPSRTARRSRPRHAARCRSRHARRRRRTATGRARARRRRTGRARRGAARGADSAEVALAGLRHHPAQEHGVPHQVASPHPLRLDRQSEDGLAAMSDTEARRVCHGQTSEGQNGWSGGPSRPSTRRPGQHRCSVVLRRLDARRRMDLDW